MKTNADNRPASADLVDLHIFVVPIQSWLGKYSVAYNNVALQSTSAGFIRVVSHATLTDVRELIEDQLGTDIIPEQYVFLRSVGRCLAIVNQSQEKTMKAKYFLPPVAFSPEIFILPGSHEWIASLRKQTKSIVVNGDIPAQDEYRLKNSDLYRREVTDDYPPSEQYSDYGNGNTNKYSPGDQAFQHSRGDVKEDLTLFKGKTPESENEPETSDPSEMLLQKANSKQTRKHFSDIVKAKKKKAEREDNSFQVDNDYLNKGDEELFGQDNTKHVQTDVMNVEPSQMYEKNYQDETKSKVLNENGSVKYDKQSQESIESSRETLVGGRSPKAAVNERSTLEVKNGVVEGSSKSLRKNKSDDSSLNREKGNLNDNENEKIVMRNRSEVSPKVRPAIQVLHPEIVTNPSSPHVMSRATPIPSANVIHSTLTMDGYERPSEGKLTSNGARRPSDEPKSLQKSPPESPPISPPKPEEEPITGAPEEDANEKGDYLQTNNRYAKSVRSQSQRGLNAEEIKRREEEKRRLEEERIKMNQKKKSIENDTMQMMKEMEGLLRQKKEEEEKRKAEEEKRKQEEKERMEQKKIEAFQLRDQLIKIRDERLQRQKERESLMKNARDLKARLAAKRSVEPSIWEKKYLTEKERALKLEEELNLLKSELDASQKKLLKIFENKETDGPVEQKSPRVITGPSQLNNLKNEVRRMKKEKEGLEIDIERTKKKLVAESKQKAAAHQELKDLRNLKRTAVAAKAEKVQSPRTQLSDVDKI